MGEHSQLWKESSRPQGSFAQGVGTRRPGGKCKAPRGGVGPGEPPKELQEGSERPPPPEQPPPEKNAGDLESSGDSPGCRFSGMGVKVVGSQREEGGACQIHLRVPAVCKAPDIDGAQVRVLVDTGAEVCLIKKGLLPDLVVERAENH